MKLDNSTKLLMLNEIIESFEDLIDGYGIEIPNEEKKENPDASNIYGTDYYSLEERIEKILTCYDLLEEEK